MSNNRVGGFLVFFQHFRCYLKAIGRQGFANRFKFFILGFFYQIGIILGRGLRGLCFFAMSSSTSFVDYNIQVGKELFIGHQSTIFLDFFMFAATTGSFFRVRRRRSFLVLAVMLVLATTLFVSSAFSIWRRCCLFIFVCRRGCRSFGRR